jgi:hypothetical protein
MYRYYRVWHCRTYLTIRDSDLILQEHGYRRDVSGIAYIEILFGTACSTVEAK